MATRKKVDRVALLMHEALILSNKLAEILAELHRLQHPTDQYNDD